MLQTKNRRTIQFIIAIYQFIQWHKNLQHLCSRISLFLHNVTPGGAPTEIKNFNSGRIFEKVEDFVVIDLSANFSNHFESFYDN